MPQSAISPPYVLSQAVAQASPSHSGAALPSPPSPLKLSQTFPLPVKLDAVPHSRSAAQAANSPPLAPPLSAASWRGSRVPVAVLQAQKDQSPQPFARVFSDATPFRRTSIPLLAAFPNPARSSGDLQRRRSLHQIGRVVLLSPAPVRDRHPQPHQPAIPWRPRLRHVMTRGQPPDQQRRTLPQGCRGRAAPSGIAPVERLLAAGINLVRNDVKAKVLLLHITRNKCT